MGPERSQICEKLRFCMKRRNLRKNCAPQDSDFLPGLHSYRARRRLQLMAWTKHLPVIQWLTPITMQILSPSTLKPVQLLEHIYTIMRYINPDFTYLQYGTDTPFYNSNVSVCTHDRQSPGSSILNCPFIIRLIFLNFPRTWEQGPQNMSVEKQATWSMQTQYEHLQWHHASLNHWPSSQPLHDLHRQFKQNVCSTVVHPFNILLGTQIPMTGTTMDQYNSWYTCHWWT